MGVYATSQRRRMRVIKAESGLATLHCGRTCGTGHARTATAGILQSMRCE